MTYKWARDFALKLINQYSISGTEIPGSYNNQTDYLLRIPDLVNDAQVYIATTTGRITEVTTLADLEHVERGAWTEYTLPENCWQLSGSGLVLTNSDVFQRYNRIYTVGKNKLFVPTDVTRDAIVEYYRYPETLPAKPANDAKLDNSVEAQMAVPYYVAAHIVMHDDAFAYQALYNEFEAKLARLSEPVHGELERVEDVYNSIEWAGNEP